MGVKETVHNTFVIERKYPQGVERVFQAFADPVFKKRWFLADSKHTEIQHYELDFRDGGKEEAQMLFLEGTPIAGMLIVNKTTYLHIEQDSRIVFAEGMTLGGKFISAGLGTVELSESEGGTLLHFTNQSAFFEGADGPEMRKGGWETIFTRLGQELAV
jgi:uncharacterized protein YndB with AHSA1/START domain